MKWIAIITAPNEPIGKSLAEMLRTNGVAAYVKRDGVTVYLGTSFTPVRIMVREMDADEGRRLLAMLVGGDQEDGPTETPAP